MIERGIAAKCKDLADRGLLQRIGTNIASLFFPTGMEKYLWQQFIPKYRAWDPVLGTVVSTSKEQKIGAFDWAIVELKPEHDSQSFDRHLPYSRDDPISGFRVPSSALNNLFDDADAAKAEAHFYNGPSFKLIQRSALAAGSICLKPSGRTTTVWRIGQVSSAPNATGTGTGWVQYREIDVIISTQGAPDTTFSKDGDSGSIVLD
ncbi:hypothetical protein BKA64DRAFT_356510 [Cadophora sp. MPI-SDFR-AT-0126]|nr:hypothetical protein BKA64DRAFT_356510 [Leotiomycetes sp. MPI-SDFR-AT-0126]